MQEAQQLLWRLISAPEGVQKGIRDYRIRELPISGDHRLSGAERLDIYAAMYFFRILDCLKEDYPAVLKLLGSDRFHNLVTDYLWRYPPRHWSLRTVGDRLPLFVKASPLFRRYRYLAELAEMEWQLLEVFDAADQAVLREEDLKAIEPARWGGIPLALHPSVRLKSFRWPVDRIREGILKRRPLTRIGPEETPLLFWRQGLKVFYRRISSGEWRLISSLRDGDLLDRLCERASQKRMNPAPTIARLLKGWLRDGLLASGGGRAHRIAGG